MHADKRGFLNSGSVWTKGCAFVLLGLAALTGVLTLPNFFWKTVAADEKLVAGGVYLGFKIEKPWGWRDAIRVTLYESTLSSNWSSIRLQAARLALKSIPVRRWFCDNRAIYLSIEGRRDLGSYGLDESTGITYDFERGELFTYGDAWTVGTAGSRRKRNTTEEEFHQVLQRLEEECRQ